MHANEFPLSKDICYLNHAAVAPWPARTSDAVCRFAVENSTTGAQHYPDWLGVEIRLRERLARMINASSAEDIALVKNTSEGLSFVAYGLDWRPGDRIVGLAQEFPSNMAPWQSLSTRGVEFEAIDIRNSADPEGDLITACRPGTRMLAVSSVDYALGTRLDLARLGAHCRTHDILFCVDAIQSIGALEFDVQACQADFVAADGHKWMLGPEGLGLFWVRPDLRQQLKLTQFGWHMLADRGNYDAPGWTPRDDAGRFECGSPNMLAIHALDASLSLLEEVGMPEVERRVLANSRLLGELLQELPGVDVIGSRSTHPESGIITFRVARVASEKLYRELMSAGVICAARAGGVRFSPHFHTPESVLKNAIQILNSLIR